MAGPRTTSASCASFLGRLASGVLAALLPAVLAVLPAAADDPSPVPPLEHVILVIMENKKYDDARVQTYTAGLISQYSSFSQSYGVTHPSQPNYLTLWCGSTAGVTSDACPPPFSPYTAENLGSQCESHGLTWKAYSEDLPAPGSTVCTASGTLYTRKHDPWVSFTNVNHSNEVPYTQLADDITNNALPNLAIVVPNNCDNTHDCPIATGDTWLSNNLPAMISAVGPYGLVILTWDEDDFTPVNRILTVFAGPMVKTNYVSTRHIDHFTVLRTICAGLQIDAMGAAVSDTIITDVWNPVPTSVPVSALSGVRLGAARPNPSSGEVTATLELPAEHHIRAGIYDASGREVRRLASGPRAGKVELRWDGMGPDGRPSHTGIYWLRVAVDGATIQRTVVRLR